MGRRAEAEAAYRRALHVVENHLELNPDDPRAATMCAVAMCRSGEPEKGLEWAERALAIDPEDGESHLLHFVTLGLMPTRVY